MSNIIRDASGNLFNWWKNEKISGTIMPIFLILNIIKFQTDTEYSINELVANASFLILMIFAIVSYYRRSERLDAINAIRDVALDKNAKEQEVAQKRAEKDYEVAMAALALEREKFEHQKEVEEFSMEIVQKQREYQYSLITEQADFINEQIINKTDHIVYITKNFPEVGNTDKVIKMHEDEIEVLREYQRELPLKIEMRFKDFLISSKNIPKVKPSSEIIKTELDTVLVDIEENTEINSVSKEVVQPPTQKNYS